MDKFEAEYRAKLSPAQFHVLREKGTEPPFSGKYYMTNENGTYYCAACHNPLFDSKHKIFSRLAAGLALTRLSPAVLSSPLITATA